ncbi:autotransporter outer membrane beta-barrel domain-containing protein, partial [Dyella sp.]|uniref:autotransporter outer membrane beta-barrel domain-containing protein n=1 Tax=Dyella sp. TaxID=1869338 RepID=UPI002ED42127
TLADLGGALVRYDDYDQNIGRLGIRLDRTWTDDKGRYSTPYVRLNYIQGWGGKPAVNIAATDAPAINQTFLGGDYGRALELGLGGSYSLGNQFSVYGEGDYQKDLGSAGTKGWGWNVGLRWSFE